MCLTKNCDIYLFGKLMKRTKTYIFSSGQDSQLNWAKQYKHADALRIGAKQHRAFVIFITLNLSFLNWWNNYHTSIIIWKAGHNITTFLWAIIQQLWKDKYNKQLKPNCINLFLRLKLQTKPCHIIDLLHREFHKDSKKSIFDILRLFCELLCISKVHPWNLQKQKKRKTDLAPGTLAFPRITPQPTNTIHMSLGFASGTLRFTLFTPEVLCLLPVSEGLDEQVTNRNSIRTGHGRARQGRAPRQRSDDQRGKGNLNVARGNSGLPSSARWRQ